MTDVKNRGAHLQSLIFKGTEDVLSIRSDFRSKEIKHIGEGSEHSSY